MRRCDVPSLNGVACPGHLVKFDDCLAEALHEWSLDSALGSAGDGGRGRMPVAIRMTRPGTRSAAMSAASPSGRIADAACREPVFHHVPSPSRAAVSSLA
jgi:hypothetical protein